MNVPALTPPNVSGTARQTPVRVLSIPAGHRYITHAIAPAGSTDGEVQVLADPVVPGAPPGQWWPHQGLDPEWIAAHHSEFDVVHVHFGFEHLRPEQLRHWADALDRAGLPLVVTVHDLWLPHSADHETHQERLGVLLQAATTVLTLTDGAAAAVQDRFGIQPVVVPHPRMVDLTTIQATSRTPAQPIQLGLHLKSLRANAAGAELVEALLAATAGLRQTGEVQVRLDAHRELAGDDARVADLHAVMSRAAEQPGAQVHWGDRLGDAALHRYLRQIDVSVIPHRWGTHSGWLEECLDLGVVPLVPQVGFLTEQADVPSFSLKDGVAEPDSLKAALEQALERARAGRTAQQAAAWAAHRQEQDRCTQATHRDVYRQALNRWALGRWALGR